MGSFFAIGDAAGIPLWIVQRLWIAAVLALGAWGVVRLVERLFPSRSQSAGFIAGLIFITGPYITVGLTRGTAWLLAASLLPWLLLWTSKGIAKPNGWIAPAVFALLLAAAGGGLNAAIVVWLLAAIVLFGLFEAFGPVGLRPVLAFTWRAVVLCFLTSLWWVIPVIIQARFGANYLTFTEHAEAILHTPSASESLRLMGYWVAYINGYPDLDPQLPAIGGYLLSAPTILATFAVPVIAIASLLFLRRWRYGAFFALLLALSVLAMSVGFPQQSWIGRAVTDLYYSAGLLQFMRTTYKAAPLAALALACLAGVGLGSAFDAVRSVRLNVNGTGRAVWPASAVLIVLVGALVLLWGRPLWSGNAVDSKLFFSSVPAPWVEAIDQAQSATPADTRIAVLPGELFGWYTWAGTQNSVAPGLSDKPVLVRQITRPATEQAAQLLDSFDARVQQGRLTPGQLPPLLQLMGVGRVLVGTDSSPLRSEALDPARVEAELAQQPGFEKPAASFGRVATFNPPADRGGAAVRLGEVRAYSAPRPARPRISRVHPAMHPAVVDGDADGIVAMAGVGALSPGLASFYAADLSRASLRALLPDQPTLTFTDSNRRRGVLVAKLTTNTGPTLGAQDPLAREFPDYDPFRAEGMTTRTVAVYGGLESLYSPLSPGFTLFPEHRPFAALDGRKETSWITQEKDPARRYLQINLRHPIALSGIRIRPHRDGGGATSKVFVSVNGGPEKLVALRSGWNTVPVNNSKVTSLRLRVPGRNTYFGGTAGGIDEVDIPGLHVTEALRMPTRLAALAMGQDLSTSAFDIVAERVTADFPRRVGKPAGVPSALDPLDMSDAEKEIRRIVALPAARNFVATGWGSVSPDAPDSSLDRLAGVSAANSYDSSSRFEGVPLNRASSAFDRNPKTAWIAEYNVGNNPWLRWRGTRPVAVRRLVLQRLPGRYLLPTRVTVATPSGGFDLRVSRAGVVELPRTITTRELKLTIRSVKRLGRTARGVGVPRAVALSQVEIPGIPVASPRRSGKFESECGAASVASGGSSSAVRFGGQFAAFDAGDALAFTACGSAPQLRLLRGSNLFVAAPGPIFSVDSLLLRSSAPRAAGSGLRSAAAISPTGKVNLNGPGWLVLGQSYSPGWRAWCTDSGGSERELGSPRQIDGFANGWRISGATCVAARFAFGPQRYANIGYWISGLTGLMLLVLITYGAWQRRGGRAVDSAPVISAAETTVALTTSGGIQLKVGGRRGEPAPSASSRRGPRTSAWLYAFAVGAVVAVGLLYVVNPATSAKGINFDYPLDHTTEHWIALAAMISIVVGAVVDIVARRRGGSGDG
jgi:arabinofuranan 3-O-arabinosyltransferase